MFTNDEKKKMVEYGIKEFNLHPDFLTWLIDEFNDTYDAILEEKLKIHGTTVSESDMWTLEWRWILYRAIQRRKTSWGNISPAMIEYRNAGDTLAGEVIDEMKKKGLINQL